MAELAVRAVIKAGLAEKAEEVRTHAHASGLFTILRAETKLGVAAVKLEPSIVCRAEVDGLEALRAAGAPVPAVLAVEEEGENAALAMEFIPPGRRPDSADLANALAHLYSARQESWGYPRSNFIGSLPQPNQIRTSFAEHWWKDRIEPQMNRAAAKGLLDVQVQKRLEKVVLNRSTAWALNETRPRLIHGDLWSGNVMFGKDRSVLIDPAVAWGHPEQDLAMLELFGSPLGSADLDRIGREAALAPGRSDRRAFFQIYPLLVHVNLFGSGYCAQLDQALRACE